MELNNEAWCILRCQGRSTMSLAESLAKDGFEVWTPVETVTLRARRSHPQEIVSEALLPSYVFARSFQIPRLLELLHRPSLQYRVWDPELRRMVVRGHPHFSLMRGFNTPFAMVEDAQLRPLRTIADRRRPKASVDELENGDRIRMTEGCYAGLAGVIVDCEGIFPKVQLDGSSQAFRPARWLLQLELDADHSAGVTSGQALSAKAA